MKNFKISIAFIALVLCLNNQAYAKDCPFEFNEPGGQCVCGLAADKTQSLSTNDYGWPSIVYIEYSSYSKICAGYLINNQTILTAAHCLPSNESEKYNVWLGFEEPDYISKENLLAVKYKVENGKNIAVKNILKHEAYNPQNNLNDIAILKLDKPVNRNEHIQFGCMSKSAAEFENMNPYVVEWDETPPNVDTEIATFQLKISELKIPNGVDCRQAAKDKLNNFKLMENSQICGGVLAPNEEKCGTNFGGFLFYIAQINNEKKYVLTGILSKSSDAGCGIKNKLNVFTSVSFYESWIHEKITGVPKPTTTTTTTTTTPPLKDRNPDILLYAILAGVVVVAVLCGVIIFVFKRNKNGNGRNRNVEENANSDKLLDGSRR